MESALLLNGNYDVIGPITVKRAIKLIIKGKVEIIESYNSMIKSVNQVFLKPKIVRLRYIIKSIYKGLAVFSKKGVFIRDRYTCQYCGDKPSKLTIDHVIPESRGGNTDYLNCVTSCLRCNTKKNDRTPEEASMMLINKPYHPTIKELILLKS